MKNMFLAGIGAALAAAAVIFLSKRKMETQHEKPPRRAPQVPLHNPGDQSEFTSAPSDSEIG